MILRPHLLGVYFLLPTFGHLIKDLYANNFCLKIPKIIWKKVFKI